MVDMVSCLDAFTGQRTRMVVIVDGLDSCEQTKVTLIPNYIVYSTESTFFEILFTPNYNCEIHCLALEGFDLNTVKLCSK